MGGRIRRPVVARETGTSSRAWPPTWQPTWTPSSKSPWSSPGTGHYCLLARWTSTGDTPFGEGADINANTRNNNNIAWRNVNIVDLVSPDQLTQTVSFIVRGQLGRPTSFFDLVFRTPFDWQAPLFPMQNGEVKVDIGPQLP